MNKLPAIKLWPEKDRPREKLFKSGEHALSDTELLAILLGNGTRGENAVDLARRIYLKFGSFRKMSHVDMRDWKGFRGLGSAKVAKIKAALEIGRRFGEEQARDSRVKIRSSKEAALVLMPRMRDLKNEIFKVLLLDSENRIIEIVEIEEGTVNQACPMIREVFQKALQYFAASIICFHNHPSGNYRPSPEDKNFTEQLICASRALQIKTLDHIIIGKNGYFSFADRGMI